MLGAAVAFGAGGYVLRGHPDTTPVPSSVAQLASVKTGCDDWVASTASNSPMDTWCSGMVGWMSERTGRAMMGSGMWAGPDELGASCRQWADDTNQSGDSAASTCDEMVAWMNGHAAGRWGMWTMHD